MGQQSSTLNCKVNQNNQKHQVTNTRQFFAIKKKFIIPQEQPDASNTNFPTQNVIPQKSPKTQLTRATSEKNLSSKSFRQVTKIKTLIPQHESITKVSEFPFKGSFKGKRFYAQQKIKSLAEIVQSRYNTPKHFPYSQILSLTQSLVYSLAYMIKKKCNHHDFYPTNIYYSEGRFKIINPLQLPTSGFYLTCQRQRFSFLSPQLIIAILEEIPQTDLGEDFMSKSDVFAIGMILLEICSLQPSSECYDEESYNIVDSVIRERLAKVAKVYTPVMAECINMMLQYEAQARIDPLTLAQLVHWKIENEKLIAMQMQMPKQQQQVPVSQQGSQGPPGKRMTQNMPPQQIRGPPPPYMHQPFMMQNLNPNVIAVSLPNQQYTRIGPNNQGFLSSSSLQQKLRVIELIKEHPEENDDEAQQDSMVEENSQFEPEKQPKQPPKSQMRNVFLEKQDPKPKYPFVESIYSEKPLMEVNFQTQTKPHPQIVRQIMPQNRQQTISQPQINRVPLVRQPSNILNPNVNPYQGNEFNQRKVQTFVRQEVRAPLVQGYDEIKIQMPKMEQMKPKSPTHIYNEVQKHQIFNSYQSQNFTKSETQFPPFSSNQVGERIQVKIQAKTQFVTSNNYGTLTSKNSPTINNIYTMGQPSNAQTSFGHIQNQSGSYDSGQSYAKKYGTSFQTSTPTENYGETIQERVQRVLNMSKNAK